VAKKTEAAPYAIKPKEIKMIITKLHLGIALFASAYLYYSNPSTSSKNELPSYFRNPTTNPFAKKASLTEEVYADFCMQCHLPNGRRWS
jgi:hypothetical protein